MDKDVVERFLREGYNKRDAMFYAHIHEVTQGGEKGTEAFVLQVGQSLEAILPPADGTRETALARTDIERLYTQGGAYTRDFVWEYVDFIVPKIETGRKRSLTSAVASFFRKNNVFVPKELR